MTKKPNTTNPNDANGDTLEYVGGLKFEAQDFDLESLPTNKEAAIAAAEMMPWIRLASLLLRLNDDKLVSAVEDEPEEHVEMLEGIAAALNSKKQDVKILKAGFCRLTVALERTIGKDEINRAYGTGVAS